MAPNGANSQCATIAGEGKCIAPIAIGVSAVGVVVGHRDLGARKGARAASHKHVHAARVAGGAQRRTHDEGGARIIKGEGNAKIPRRGEGVRLRVERLGEAPPRGFVKKHKNCTARASRSAGGTGRLRAPTATSTHRDDGPVKA